MNKETIWNILIENELYKIVETAESKEQKENFIENYCKNNNIPVEFAKNKLDKMKKDDIKRKTYEEEER